MTDQIRIGGAVYELEADPSKLTQDLSKAASTIKSAGAAAEQAFGRQATGAIKKTEAATGRLMGKLKTMGAAGGVPGSILGGVGLGAGLGIFNMVTAGIGKVTDYLGRAVVAAREEEAEVIRLSTSLEANAKGWDGNVFAVENWIGTMVQATAFADSDLRNALTNLTGVTGNLTEAQELVATATDLARFRDMELAKAADLVGKVYNGKIGALSKAGIVLDKNATSTEALTELQRRAAGQASRFANSNEGAAERSKLAWEDASESIGAMFTGLERDWNQTLADTAVSFQDLLPGPGREDLMTFVTDLTAGMGKAAEEGVDLGEHIHNAFNILVRDRGEIESLWTEMEGWARDAGLSHKDFTNAVRMLAPAFADQERPIQSAGAVIREYLHKLQTGEGVTRDVTAATYEMGQSFDDATVKLLDLAKDGFAKARGEGKDLERQWDRLHGGPDKLSQSIERLQGDVDTWSQRYQQALRDRDYDAAAFALAQHNRVSKQLADSEALRDTLKKDRAALLAVGNAAEGIPGSVTTTVRTPGLRAALTGLRAFGDAVAAAQQASGVYALGGPAPRTWGPGAGVTTRPRDRGQNWTGGSIRPGEWGTFNERGPERIRNVAGVALIEPMRQLDRGAMFGGGSGGTTTYVTNNYVTHIDPTIQGHPMRAETPGETVRALRRATRMGVIGPSQRGRGFDRVSRGR